MSALAMRPFSAGRTCLLAIILSTGLLLGCASVDDECVKQDDCFDCPECRTRYGDVCVEGRCLLSGEPDPADEGGYPLVGSYLAYVLLPRGVDPARMRSAAVRVLHPQRTDGTPLTCEKLLADPGGVDEGDSLNKLRVLQPPLSLTSSADLTTISVGHVPVGEDRLFFVRLHTERNGEGNVLGVGCVAGVRVEQGLGQRLEIETAKLD